MSRTASSLNVRINDLEREMNSADSKLSNLPSQERELLKLNRDLTVKQQLFVFLLQQREQTALRLATAFPKGTLVDTAYTLSKPVGLGKKSDSAARALLRSADSSDYTVHPPTHQRPL